MTPRDNLLVNGQPVEVTYQDGTKETVYVKTLSIRQLSLFTNFLGSRDTPGLVALCVGKPVEWVDTLTDESYCALPPKCTAVNFKRAVAISREDPIAAAELVPFLVKLEAMIKSAPLTPPKPASIGSESSPAPAPSESAAATGSGSST